MDNGVERFLEFNCGILLPLTHSIGRFEMAIANHPITPRPFRVPRRAEWIKGDNGEFGLWTGSVLDGIIMYSHIEATKIMLAALGRILLGENFQ